MNKERRIGNLELNNIIGKITNFTKDFGNKVISELSNAIANNKLTDASKVKLQDKTRDIIKSHGEVYEVKNRGVYKYSLDNEYEELQKGMYLGQEKGYYILDDQGNLRYDEELNKTINSEINIEKSSILKEQQKESMQFRKQGETYTVDELGDDERYAYLTRKSDRKEMQDFNISDELYDKIKENNKKGKETELTWNGKEYEIK